MSKPPKSRSKPPKVNSKGPVKAPAKAAVRKAVQRLTSAKPKRTGAAPAAGPRLEPGSTAAVLDRLFETVVARRDADPNVSHSARLLSRGKVTALYGYIEARLHLPTGQGIWPAFWMLGADLSAPGVGWPECGEIDIMENKGREPGINHSSLHGPSYSGEAPLTATYTLPDGQKFSDGYHTFGVLWTQDSVAFSVDGHVFETRTPADLPPGKAWVFTHPFFFLLNVAVGGHFGGDPDATTVFPQKMLVDYIRVYKPL